MTTAEGVPFPARLRDLAAQRGDDVAVVVVAADGDARGITFAELDAAANQWGRALAGDGAGQGSLVWFWPGLTREGLALPVIAYIFVLGAMVCAAVLARLPSNWAAVGAVCFAVSDAMIGIGRFVLGNEALAVPVWWSYAAAQILITAGFFFGRSAADAGDKETAGDAV